MTARRPAPAPAPGRITALLGGLLVALAPAGCDDPDPGVCRTHEDCRVCQRCVNGACRDDLTLDSCTLLPRCDGCLDGRGSCGAACRGDGYASGYCGAPLSADPAVCCTCTDSPCDAPAGGVLDRGEAVGHAGQYDYAPTALLDRERILRLWWVSQGAAGQDAVFTARSVDGATWSAPAEVLVGAGPPHQGEAVSAPSVVQAADGQYLMFFTTDDLARAPDPRYQIFLARSADGRAWEHTNEGRPVGPPGDPDEDIIHPSAVALGDRILLFHARQSGGLVHTYLAESADGGLTFTALHDDRPVIESADACDAIYLSGPRQYLLACQAPLGALELLRLYLLDRDDLRVVAELEPAHDRWREPCNHSPALLGGPAGVAVDDRIVPLFFGAGTQAGGVCWNPDSWDIHLADLYTEPLWEPDCR